MKLSAGAEGARNTWDSNNCWISMAFGSLTNSSLSFPWRIHDQ